MPLGFPPWALDEVIRWITQGRDDWLAQMRADDDGMRSYD
jgi:hypothetical protein